MSDDIKLPPATLCEARNQATGERQVSDHDDAYYDSNWVVARPISTADEVRAAILADREARGHQDLLEALQDLVAMLPDPELDNDDVQKHFVKKAVAVIAKATGEAA